MPNKLFYITIDSLRYDALKSLEATKILFPNIYKLINKGFLSKAIANGQSTQFVLPSQFSSTYPLDYGGYNEGIRKRPASYVECVKEHNYETILFNLFTDSKHLNKFSLSILHFEYNLLFVILFVNL